MQIEKVSIGGKEIVGDREIKEISELEVQLQELANAAEQTAVTDTSSYESAASFLDRVVALNKIIEGSIEPVRKITHQAYKDVLAKKKDMLAPGERAEKHLRGEMTRYMKEQERIRQEEERKRIEAARVEAEKRAEEEFERAIEEGDDIGAELALESANSVTVDTSDLEELTPDVGGISYRATYKAKLTDIKRLCLAVAKGEVSEDYVSFNQSHANKVARSLKNEMQIPGVEVVEDKTLVRR